MTFLEKDLEDIIFNAPSGELQKRGLKLFSNRKRQLRVGNYGISDIISIGRDSTPFGSKFITIQVLELKQDKVDFEAFFQAVRYVKGVQRWFTKFKQRYPELSFEIILIGKTIDLKSPLIYLTDIFTGDEFSTQSVDVNFYTYNYDFDGIKFNQLHGYQLTDEGF